MHKAHALAAATRGSLQHHRITDPLSQLTGFVGRLQAMGGARHERYPRLLHGLPCAGLRSHGIDRRRAGPDEFHPVIDACLGELRILGEESVPGMDGIGARAAGHIENLRDVEIGFGSSGRANRVCLIRLANVQRGAVHIGVNHHCGNPHLVARAQHAHRDLSPVGNENLLEHSRGSTKRSTNP